MADKNKAKIIVYDNSDSEIKTITVLYNPNKYTVSKRSNFKTEPIAGEDTPIPQYVSGGENQLSLELFFDTTTQRTQASDDVKDVRDYIEEIRKLLDIYSDDHIPPKCVVSWGSLAFEGYLAEITENYTLFSNEGIPIRATATVKFTGNQKFKDQIKGSSKQSADRTKERVLKEGDQLWALAAREYRDSNQWKAIAEANDIDNPRKLKTGKPIIVPALE